MSYAFSVSRRGVRTAAALGAATLGLLATAGCGMTEPTALTTVTVGSETVTTEATCLPEGDGGLTRKEGFACLKKKPDATITVKQGDRIHLGVEPDMAETGWIYFVNQRPMSAEAMKSTYQTVDSNDWFQPNPNQPSPPKKVTLSVTTLGKNELKGIWNITVEREQ
ncbi:hypothetical protein [Streptomyces sp. TR06-5]|uniref:hypothetical protein n=1 Tax=unclassified Streptomyces TaxID=2593676 RepID=UPI0039A08DF3